MFYEYDYLFGIVYEVYGVVGVFYYFVGDYLVCEIVGCGDLYCVEDCCVDFFFVDYFEVGCGVEEGGFW